MTALEQLHALVADHGELVSAARVPVADPGPGYAALAAAGPRAAGDPAAYELVVEAIYEGYLMHYGTPRVMTTEDRDLALLAGDRLYALGLGRLVALGDIPAVIELSDVISLCALVHERGEPALTDTIWHAGAVAVGHATTPAHEHAKALLRTGSGDARQALIDAAVRTGDVLKYSSPR